MQRSPQSWRLHQHHLGHRSVEKKPSIMASSPTPPRPPLAKACSSISSRNSPVDLQLQQTQSRTPKLAPAFPPAIHLWICNCSRHNLGVPPSVLTAGSPFSVAFLFTGPKRLGPVCKGSGHWVLGWDPVHNHWCSQQREPLPVWKPTRQSWRLHQHHLGHRSVEKKPSIMASSPTPPRPPLAKACSSISSRNSPVDLQLQQTQSRTPKLAPAFSLPQFTCGFATAADTISESHHRCSQQVAHFLLLSSSLGQNV